MKRFFFVVLVMVCCVQLHNQEQQWADDSIEAALLWMFEKGLPQHYSNVSENELRRLIRIENDAGFYTAPHSNEPFYKLLFSLQTVGITKAVPNKRTGVTLRVSNYAQDIQNNVIEYWVVRRHDGNFRYNKCRFIITIADNLRSRRRIVIDTDEFIESAVVGGRTIRFPRENLYILYSLEARNWPQSYTNTDLADYQVEFDKNKVPYLRKIGNWERRWYNARNKLN